MLSSLRCLYSHNSHICCVGTQISGLAVKVDHRKKCYRLQHCQCVTCALSRSYVCVVTGQIWAKLPRHFPGSHHVLIKGKRINCNNIISPLSTVQRSPCHESISKVRYERNLWAKWFRWKYDLAQSSFHKERWVIMCMKYEVVSGKQVQCLRTGQVWVFPIEAQLS